MSDDLLERMAQCLRICAEDLAAEVDARYPSRTRYNLEHRRYLACMTPVEEARRLLAEYRDSKRPL